MRTHSCELWNWALLAQSGHIIQVRGEAQCHVLLVLFSDIVHCSFTKKKKKKQIESGLSVLLPSPTSFVLPLQLLSHCRKQSGWRQKNVGFLDHYFVSIMGICPAYFTRLIRVLTLHGRKSADVFILNLAGRKTELWHSEGGTAGGTRRAWKSLGRRRQSRPFLTEYSATGK